MNKKILIIFSLSVIAIFWIYFQVASFFTYHLNEIEKNQKQIISELKKTKTQANISPSDSSEFVAMQDLGKIKDDLRKLKDQVEGQNDILGLYNVTPLPSPTLSLSKILNFIMIADRKWQSIDVFQEKNSSSKIVGQIIYGKSYPYTKKENGYYYIEYADSQYGWVNQQFLREF